MIRPPRGATRTQLLLHTSLVCLAVVWAYPVIWTLTNSVKSTADLYSAPWNLPNPLHVENIRHAWCRGNLARRC